MKNLKYKPEIIVLFSLGLFGIGLFLGDEKARLTLQLSSSAVTGYFGFISSLSNDENN